MMEERDQLFDQRIHDAYESVSLSDEAQDRMLANLLAAQATRSAGKPADEGAPEARVDEPRRASAPAHMKPQLVEGGTAAPKRRGWRVVLPLAAVLLVAVAIVQVTALRSQEAMMAAPSAAEMEAISDGGAAAGSGDVSAKSESADAAPLAEEEAYDMVADNAEEGDLGAKALQAADWYPRITLGDDTILTTLIDGMDTVEVSADRVGKSVGAAKAQPFDTAETIACEVFELTDEAGAYAVRYEGEQSYWYCVPLE